MSDQDNIDYSFKILLIGDAGVGKSSILLRFTDNTFNPDQTATIGVDFKPKILKIDGKNIRITLWDTAGQERFRTLINSYYRGAQGIILVYDVTRRDSFENLNYWLNECENYCTNSGKDAVKLIVANKIDRSDRVVSQAEGEQMAKDQGTLYIETSAKTNIGISSVFDELIHKILENPSILSKSIKPKRVINPTPPPSASTIDDTSCGC
ncbi:hypothetical protein WA158_001386 [Blastocystis sp. Blastoise]